MLKREGGREERRTRVREKEEESELLERRCLEGREGGMQRERGRGTGRRGKREKKSEF